MLDFDKDIAVISGWLTKSEGELLYEKARELGVTDTIVEIGSWVGRSTICLAKGVEDGGGAKIYAIDPHTGSSEHRVMFGKVDTITYFEKAAKISLMDRLRNILFVVYRTFFGWKGLLAFQKKGSKKGLSK